MLPAACPPATILPLPSTSTDPQLAQLPKSVITKPYPGPKLVSSAPSPS